MTNAPTFTRSRWDALPPAMQEQLKGRVADFSYQPTFNWLFAMVLGAVIAAQIAHLIFSPHPIRGVADVMLIALLNGCISLPLALALWRNRQRARIASQLGFYFLDDAVVWRDGVLTEWQIPFASVQRITLEAKSINATVTRHDGLLTLVANDGTSIVIDNDYDVDALFTALYKQCPNAENWSDPIFSRSQNTLDSRLQAAANIVSAPHDLPTATATAAAAAIAIANARQPIQTTADFSFNDEVSARICFEGLLKSAHIDCVSRGYSRLDEHLVEIAFALRLPVADFVALRPHITSYQLLGFQDLQVELQPWLDANPNGCITLRGTSLDWTWFSMAAPTENP